MNNKALTMSLLAAAFAVLFMHSYVTSIENDSKNKFGTEVLVMTAKRDIKEMQTLTEDLLDLKLIPKTFREPAAIYFEQAEQDQNTEKEKKRLAGSVAVVPIKQGEQITFNKLTDPSMRTGIAPQVSPGKRAVAIGVNDVTAVGKLVKPGDRVDLIGVIALGDRKEQKVSKIIVQDVVVLAVGKFVTNNVARSVEMVGGKPQVKALAEFDGYTNVTLELEPKDAQMIALLTSGGDHHLSLALRNNDDSELARTNAVSLGDLFAPEMAKVRTPAGGGR